MKKIIVSWSGGKDSCFVLDRLINQGFHVVGLITTASTEHQRSFAHDFQEGLLMSQAKALELPLYILKTDIKKYTEDFVQRLEEIKQYTKAEAIAFGDLYLDGHREWGEAVAKEVGLEALYPLWMKEEEALTCLQSFLETGYQAVITRIDPAKIHEAWLGKTIDESFYKAVQNYPICPMGESGEYHTLVIDGPVFQKKMKVDSAKTREMSSTLLYDIERYSWIEK